MDGTTNTETVTERLRMLMPQTPLRELQYTDNDTNNDYDNGNSIDNDNDNNVQGSDDPE